MGKKSGPKAPPAPDPVAISNAQTQSNIATAQEQQRLNMVNSYGPDGSVTYAADATAPGGFRQTTTLSPELQGLQTGAYNLAGTAVQNAQGALGQPLVAPQLRTEAGFNQQLADSIYNQARSRLDPYWNQQEDRTRTRLANQGFGQFSTGAQAAMDDFGRGRNDAYNQAAYSSIQQGAQQGLAESQFANEAAQQGFQNQATAQNMPINQLGALLSAGQVQGPQGVDYTASAVAPTDVVGAYGLQSAHNQAMYNAKSQQQGGFLGGLFDLGAAAITKWSDRRLKRDIRRVGDWRGFPLYAFKYLWSDREERGVMAQDVIKTRPDAVTLMGNGFFAVNYGAL